MWQTVRTKIKLLLKEQFVLGPRCVLILNSSEMLGNNLLQQTFSDAFFLGALRVNIGFSQETCMVDLLDYYIGVTS